MEPNDAKSEKANPGENSQQSLSQVLQSLANYSVIAVFCLYVVGFIIWHSHLRRFHAYPSNLLQLEFLSAALCYVVTISLFAVPAACLFHLWHGDLFLAQPSRKEFISQIFLVWVAVLVAVRLSVFPTKEFGFTVTSIALNLVMLVAMVLGIVSILFHRSGRTVRILSLFPSSGFIMGKDLTFRRRTECESGSCRSCGSPARWI